MSVDDNPMLGEAVGRWVNHDPGLRWDGWLAGGEGVLEAVALLQPAVVLLDLEIPGTDTFALLRELSEKAPQTHVLMLSGHLRREGILSSLDAGALGYVGKHRTPQYIAQAIRTVAEGEFFLCDEAAAAAGLK